MTTRTLASIALLLAGLFLAGSPAVPQNPAIPVGTKIEPKLIPIAETRLLMEGLANANFRGLERILKQMPTEDKAWTFARGQALLIGETANLLMLRPPHSKEAVPTWFARSMELRNAATHLALTISKRDFDGSRAELSKLAGHCNRCHQNFRVKTQITAFDDKVPAP